MRLRKMKTEKTLDIVIDDVELRFTSNWKRVVRIYAQGLENVIVQWWIEDMPANDEICTKLLELPRGTIITVTGKSYTKDVELRSGETRTVAYLDIQTWTDNAATDEPPTNITEVPF